MSGAPRAARALRFSAACCAALAAAACEHVPPAPIDPSANGERIAARTLASPAVQDALARHGLSVSGNTWSLDQLTLAAWLLRTDVAVAGSELHAARAATEVEGQRRNPTVTSPNEKVVDSGAADPWVIGAALALTFEPGHKRDIRRERALAEERALEWRFGETLWAARAEVRTALLDLSTARELVALDDLDAKAAQDYLAWVETRLQAGAATTSERLAAVRAVNESASRRGVDAAALATASATLAATVGVAPRELGALELAVPGATLQLQLAADDVDAARDAALVNRLDVRRALAEYDVAEQTLRAAVASQYPDITFAPGYLVDQADHKITLGLDLPVPLFHNADAQIRRAIASRAVAAAKFDDVQAAALASIDVGFAQYEASRGALGAAERAERDAQEAAAALERQRAAGAANRGQVLAGQIALLQLRRTTLAARRAVVDAITALENGIERPLYPESSIETAATIEELLVRAPQ
ncbi:MAG TPA: TolC family protein [Gammaproteobacteria bacterium]